MSLVTFAAEALAWLGRQGTRAVALSIFCGLAVPQLAATFKPLVGVLIFILLTLAFLRVDPAELRKLFVAPKLLLVATVWTMLIVPTLLCGAFSLARAQQISPDLFPALILQASTPPITTAPAFAALMGLDAAVSLALLVVTTLVTPVTTPLLADWFLGAALPVSPLALGIRLFLFLAAAAALSGLLRWAKGRTWVESQHGRIDGLNVIVLFVFAIGLMDGVAARLWADPLTVVTLIALSFGVSLVQIALTTFVFSRVGWARAFVLGLAVGQRNLGLAIATTGSALPEMSWLYFSLAQFPIYLTPQIMKPIARRMLGAKKPPA